MSTQKYRYYDGTNTYVVYLDSRNIVLKAEAYLPNSSSKKSSTKKPKTTSDPYHAKDYMHPEDLYDFDPDDFWDYEDAEDYWEEYG